MKKYIYGNYDAQIVPHIEINEFHTLSVFLGAYLVYSGKPEYKSFSQLVDETKLVSEMNNDVFYWSYINKAHRFIRDRLLTKESCSKYNVSRRQIRKLGYSGHMSPRMYPLSGNDIQNEMFDFVFNNASLEQVKEKYLDYIYSKWMLENNTRSFFTSEGGEKATENAYIKFLDFQYKLLSQKGKHILKDLSANNTYELLQNQIEERRQV